MKELKGNESVWKRGWHDTKSVWKSLPFIIIELMVPVAIGLFFGWYWSLIEIVCALLGTLLVAVARVPIKQRNEAREKVTEMEKEREPCIEVSAFSGQMREPIIRDNKTSWAALKVKNASSAVDLRNVSVQILELRPVMERQDKQGMGTGTYDVYKDDSRWNPANVFWDESNAPAKQFELNIPRGATRVALIAFHLKNGIALGIFNTPRYQIMMESKIVIEISSASMSTWRGVYYIGYIPPRSDKFEFEEWESWIEKHKVIEQ